MISNPKIPKMASEYIRTHIDQKLVLDFWQKLVGSINKVGGPNPQQQQKRVGVLLVFVQDK